MPSEQGLARGHSLARRRSQFSSSGLWCYTHEGKCLFVRWTFPVSNLEYFLWPVGTFQKTVSEHMQVDGPTLPLGSPTGSAATTLAGGRDQVGPCQWVTPRPPCRSAQHRAHWLICWRPTFPYQDAAGGLQIAKPVRRSPSGEKSFSSKSHFRRNESTLGSRSPGKGRRPCCTPGS